MSDADLLLAGDVSGDERAAFRAVLGERVTDTPAHDVRYAACWGPEPGLLASLPALRAIFSLGAGVDHLLRDPDLPDVPVVRFVDPDLTGRMVEYVVLQCLMHLRRQRAYDTAQHARRWQRHAMASARETTVGIMGLGTLGRACAAALLAVGFDVRGLMRTRRPVENVETFGEAQRAAFLAGTDILVNLMPYTAYTHAMIDAALVDALRSTGPFGAPAIVNAGRGGSQVEADIDAALRDGRLSGASLDVFGTEPLPATSPLWDAPGAILTPHVAAITDPLAMARYVAGEIDRIERGEAPRNTVERARGY